MSPPSRDLGQAYTAARELLGDGNDLANLVAAILAAGSPVVGGAEQWALATGRSASAFQRSATAGLDFQQAVLPRLLDLARSDPDLARRAAEAVAEVAAAAAAADPIDLRRVNTAAFVAAAQLRATAPLETPLQRQQVVGSAQPQATGQAPAAADPRGAAQAAIATATETAAESAESRLTLEELYEQLDALTGLTGVKSEVRKQAELLRISGLRQARGMKNPQISRHLVFTGNPGTGKTTVARLVAQIYRVLGLLDQGHLVEVDRSGLVGGYLGQTEEKTAKVVDSALGGVLFIDEAYALTGDQYGEAAVSTLVKAIEDHRDDLVLIVAGYTEPMAEFIDSNPGLASRLRLTIEFPDYGDDELVEIFHDMASASDYGPTPECIEVLRDVLTAAERGPSFGNARYVRNIFEAATVKQAWRLRDVSAPTDAQLRELTGADLDSPPVD